MQALVYLLPDLNRVLNRRCFFWLARIGHADLGQILILDERMWVDLGSFHCGAGNLDCGHLVYADELTAGQLKFVPPAIGNAEWLGYANDPKRTLGQIVTRRRPATVQ